LNKQRLIHFQSADCIDAYKELGSHAYGDGYRFAVWAPRAQRVSVVGDFNGWNADKNPMKLKDGGIWETTVKELAEFSSYKYAILGDNGLVLKSDPYAFHFETRPGTASKTLDTRRRYRWKDGAWMKKRAQTNLYKTPMSIYELHLGSWRLDEEGRLYTYERMADELVPYVKDMGFTHVQLLPVMEHPLDLSWGYQVTGFFAANSRFGTPDGLKMLIDRFHQAGIGVLLDWVPAHFPKDEFSLRLFDGQPLYESADPTRAENRSWGTCMFDVGRPEVSSFLLSSAMFWLKEFHADGLRVDAVSYMLYLDYDHEPGTWHPNSYGDNRNLESIAFFHKLNRLVYQEVPGVCTIAEEATAFDGVTRPVHEGGLGFGFKWNMGWMHDTLDYMELDSVYRKYHHDKLTFSLMYAFSENYILPFSHDEVVHGKHSLLDKMPGDIWQKFASLRLALGYMYAHPGKKLLFMGGEFGQFIEWKELEQLDWFLLLYERHPQMQKYTAALNRFYTSCPALFEIDRSWDGFAWCNSDDNEHSILSFMRTDEEGNRLLCVFNFTPVPHEGYRIGVPVSGTFSEVFNSDDPAFDGTGDWHLSAPARTLHIPWNGQPVSVCLNLPPLGCVFYRFSPYRGFHPRTRHKPAVSTQSEPTAFKKEG